MLTPSIYFAPAEIKPLSAERRGTVLLVVLVILTIFAAVGVAFLLYAESEATTSAAFREQFEFRGPDMDPEMAFSLFLQQLIFDCKDDASGANSALRGQSFYRNMYGINYINSGGAVSLATPFVPFNGTGRLHWNHDPTLGSPAWLSGVDDYTLVNYAYCPSDGFMRFPERLGVTAGPPGKGGLTFSPKFIGGANPPYSAADPNFMALAAVKADGTVLVPSFHRDWMGFGSLDPSNPNWKTADPKLKYMVLRPRPADHPDIPAKNKKGFPYPQDAFGDVRNRPMLWAGQGNDSFWMYTGAPIMTLPDGKRYTALFAPLIIDLDGKLNLNVAGNLVDPANNAHCSNSGWAASEMNPSWVLSAPNEWKSILQGVKTPSSTFRMVGRYGKDLQPGVGGPGTSPLNGVPHFYAKVDINGRLSAAGSPNTPWTMPGAFQSWPSYSPGYGDATGAELLNHPMLYNPTASANGDRIILPSELNMLYRYGDTNTDSMLCDLWQMLPVNLQDVKKRNMITTLSYDRREPGFMPWLYNPVNPNRYELLGYVSGGPSVKPAGPALNTPKAGAATGKEYDPSWRNNLPQLLKFGYRIDLNMPVLDPATGQPRALIAYPTPSGAKQIDPANMPIFQKAQTDRQNFASTLFLALIKATGAFEPAGYNSSATLTTPTGPEVDALRYLAQLAVNMVDYIDTDDYITPFHWTDVGNAGFKADFGSQAGAWVYGTELPKVVINEAYCEYGNDTVNDPLMLAAVPAANKQATFYNVDIWAELCNPFKSDASLFGSGTAHLFSSGNATPIYRLLVTDKNLDMHKPANTDGRPDNQAATGPLDLTKVRGYVDTDFGKTGVTSILDPLGPSFNAMPNNQGANTGFYMVGPSDLNTNAAVTFPNNAAPSIPAATLNSKGMRYKFTLVNPLDTPKGPTLILQRLACPYLPHDPVATNPTYNPYVTVDYLEVPDAAVYKAITQNGNIGGAGNETPVAVDQRKSVGRTISPYAKTLATQTGSVTNQPQHTFFYHNLPATQPGAWPPTPTGSPAPFKWLTHLDRNLISPMELLHVSGHKPHELTQYFTGTQDFAGLLTGHQAPWFDNGSRLYRFFEYVQTAPRMAGTNAARIPGRININTIWDQEVFLAMCDPTLANHFDTSDVAAIFTQLKALRNTTGGLPGPGDQYFLPFSAGVVPVGDTQFPTGSGIANTLLRPFNSGAAADKVRLFELDTTGAFPGRTHPYQRMELLTKIYNNITYRSNCFAVWVTVGFFEVNDVDAQGRIYLGQEIGRAEGRNIRHKMFSIVDRSVLDASTNANITSMKAMVEGVLNNTMPFNPHATMYRELVPYFIVVE